MYPPVAQGISVGLLWLVAAVTLLVQGFVIYAAVRLALKHHRAMIKAEEVQAGYKARRQAEIAAERELKQDQATSGAPSPTPPQKP